MTGGNTTSWNWLPRATLAALLVVTEATWVSLGVSAAANASGHLRVDLPFLAFALPAVAAVALAGRCAEVRPRWQGVGLLAPMALVGMAVTAGIVGALTEPGSFNAVALHPWTIEGRQAADTAGLAWFVSTLAWGRGSWLGWETLTFRHAARSVALSSVGFVTILLVLAVDHRPSVHRATPGAALLFLVFFAVAVADLALVHERDVERESQLPPASRPSGTWLSVLTVPLLGVAAVALLVAAVIGPLAPTVGRAIATAARAIGRAIADLGREIADLFPRTAPRRSTATLPPVSGRTVRPRHVVAGHLVVPVGAVDALLVAASLGVLVLGVLFVRNLVPRFPRREAAAPALEERHDSVFTWGHLFAQLAAWLRSLSGRRRRRQRPPAVAVSMVVPISVASDELGVRHQYRRLLAAARESGHGRSPAETAAELRGRLAGAVLTGAPAESLGRLTALYEEVRYGGLGDEDVRSLDVGGEATAVVVALSGTHPPSPETGGAG